MTLTNIVIDKILNNHLEIDDIPETGIDKLEILKLLSRYVFINKSYFAICRKLSKTLVFTQRFWGERYKFEHLPNGYKELYLNLKNDYDIILKCSNGNTYAHRVILKAIGYLKSDKLWNNLTVKESELLLEFIYTRNVKMTKANTKILLKAAFLFKDKQLEAYCINYIAHVVETSYHIGIHKVWWALDLCIQFDMDKEILNWLKYTSLNYLYELPQIQNYKKYSVLFD